MVKTTAAKKVKSGSYKWEMPAGPSIIWDFECSPVAGSDPLSEHGSITRYQEYARRASLANPDVVPASRVKWCTISLSEVVSRGHRLEAGVFDVDAKRALERIAASKFPTTTVSGVHGLSSSYTCPRFKRVWVVHSEYPIYQPSSITEIKPAPDGYLSLLTQTDIENLRVKKGQVLLTCSGTIGNVSYVSKTLDRHIFSHDLLRIDCKSSDDAGYIYAYFKTKTGNTLLKTNGYGSVITHLEPEHLASVPIPDAPAPLKMEIHDRIVRSYELRDESNDLIDEATALLIDALQLPPLHVLKGEAANPSAVTPTNEALPAVETFQVKLSRLDGRADASYHIPLADAIVQHLHKHAAEVTTVGDPRISRDVILPGRFKRVYVEEGDGRVFIGGKQIGELDPSNKKYLSVLHHGDRIENQLELHENMTLITRSGTIGKVALVPKHWEAWVASEHIIRVIPASQDIAGYLYIFLNSEYAYPLITRFTYGSVVDEIDDNHVRQIPIPLLKSQDVQTRINDLALQANEKRYQAYLLEQEAIDMMNEKVIFAK